MSRYAQVDKNDSNKVINLVIWDGSEPYEIPDNVDLILVADGVDVGFDYTYDYDTQTFSPPA